MTSPATDATDSTTAGGRAPGWALWRQDDNGNRFPVGRFSSREEAGEKIVELSRCQHKQFYWIEETMTANE